MSIQSSLHAIVKNTDPTRSYWSADLTNGKTLSELALIFDLRAGGLRAMDWSLDLVSTGDSDKIRDVSLHCPDGQVASLAIEEPGTAFQLKIASLSILQGSKQVEAHVIGKVTNKVNGGCFCFVYDRQEGLICHATSVYNFTTWRPGVLPLGALNLHVLGVRL